MDTDRYPFLDKNEEFSQHLESEHEHLQVDLQNRAKVSWERESDGLIHVCCGRHKVFIGQEDEAINLIEYLCNLYCMDMTTTQLIEWSHIYCVHNGFNGQYGMSSKYGGL